MTRTNLITKRVTFLAALCMALSLVELAVPKPLPFMRLGLANLPLILGLEFLTGGEYAVLVILKICLQALVSGTFFSYVFLFSIGGTAASAVIMFLFHLVFKRSMTAIGISTAGSLANAAVQYVLSLFILFGEGATYIAPLLFGSAFITGILLGVVANYSVKNSVFIQRFSVCKESYSQNINGPVLAKCDETIELSEEPESQDKTAVFAGTDTDEKNQTTLITVLRLLSFAAGILILCFVKNTWVAFGVMLLAFSVTVIVRRKNGKRVRIMQSFFIFTSVLLFALFVPGGKVLFTLGKWRITLGALTGGIRRGSILLGSVFLSQLAFSREIHISGALGERIAEIFSYFGKITAAVPKKNEKIQGKNRLKEYFDNLDNHLQQVYFD